MIQYILSFLSKAIIKKIILLHTYISPSLSFSGYVRLIVHSSFIANSFHVNKNTKMEIEITDFLLQNCEYLCRFCLESEEVDAIYQNNRKDLNHDLSIYSERGYISFSDDEHLPNYLCKKCKTILDNWNIFNEKSRLSIAILMKIKLDKLACENLQDACLKPKIGKIDRNRTLKRSKNLPKLAKLKKNTNTKQVKVKSKTEKSETENSLLVEEKNTTHTADNLKENEPLSKPKKKYDKNKYAKVCPYCGIVLKAHYKKHILNHENPDVFPYKCERCSKAYKNKKALVDHVNRDHLGIRYPCEICGDVLTTKDILRLHKMSKHNDQANYKCDQCDKSFKTSKFLHKHRLRHSGK